MPHGCLQRRVYGTHACGGDGEQRPGLQPRVRAVVEVLRLGLVHRVGVRRGGLPPEAGAAVGVVATEVQFVPPVWV